MNSVTGGEHPGAARRLQWLWWRHGHLLLDQPLLLPLLLPLHLHLLHLLQLLLPPLLGC